MRTIFLAAVALGAAAAVSGQSRTDFEFRRELPTGKRFHLHNIIGDVVVTGGSGRTVQVTATRKAGRHGNPEDVVIETVELSDGVALCVRYPGQRRDENRSESAKHPCSTRGSWNNNERNDTQINFTVRVPAGLVLRLGTVSGDLMANDLEGELDLTSVSGDVRLEGGRGQGISLETVSGDVDLLEVRAREVTGHTVSGRVTFRGPVLDGGSYDFSTTSGDITVGMPERPNATLSAATFSGRFSSDLGTTQQPGRNRRRHNATWGSGSARLDVETLSGDIRITTGTR